MKSLSVKIRVIISIALICLLVTGYHYYTTKNRSPFSFGHTFGTRRHKPISENDITYLAPWMTFEYLNKVFELPPEYLKVSMGINDAKYPRITIEKFAKGVNKTSDVVMSDIKKEIKKYLEMNYRSR